MPANGKNLCRPKPTDIAVLDENDGRRSYLAFQLSATPVKTKSITDVSELNPNGEEFGLMLVHDGHDRVSETLRWNVKTACSNAIIAYDEHPNVEDIVSAIKAGASEYLTWPLDDAAISQLVDAATQGLEQSNRLLARQEEARAELRKLSPREIEVLLGISEGLTNRELGPKLGISYRTVEIHRYNALRKLGSIRTADAIRLIVEAGVDRSAGT